MKSLLTFVLTCALMSTSAQTVLRPQEQIDALRKGKSPFVRLALFPTKMVLKDAELPFAQGLTFQEGVAQSLLQHPYSAIEIDLPLEGKTATLEMYRVELLSEDYTLKLADPTLSPDEKTEGLHYRGVVKGNPGSIASLSIYGDEVLGMFSTLESGNFTIAKYKSKQNKTKNLHVLYQEDQIPNKHDFHCYTPDGQRGYSALELENTPNLRAANNCVNLYLEVDNDVFLDKGGLDATTRYIQAIFNQSATLYANDGIKLNLSQLYIWNTTSPYTEFDAYSLLIQFKNKRAGQIKGDAGLLLSYKGGGGIAVVDGLCDPFNLGYAGIGKSYNVVPAYSFTVMVLTHELGHILGSQHTHACVWNGNYTAIDGCAGFTDGGCATPPVPQEGGTIMSYCHSTQYGINFSLGFGVQPGNLIRNRIASATCMSACKTLPPPSTCREVSFTLVLDTYGNETSYEILDSKNFVVDRGGTYTIKSNGQKIEKKLCLVAGCYTLKVLDSNGDGMCCNYGNGSFSLFDSEGQVLAEGGRFGRESVTSFCIDNLGRKIPNVIPPPPPVNNNAGCINFNFNNLSITSYGESQDRGLASIIENGNGISLSGNSWKAIELSRTITTNTVLEFEFRSTQKSEIHGIGFDNDFTINTYYTFQLAGTQVWGYQDFNTYVGYGAWKKYIIRVGQKYTGDTKYLFFVNDNDETIIPGNSQFRNVRIYETRPCSYLLSDFEPESEPVPQVLVSPNPAHQQLNLQLDYFPPDQYQVQVLDLLGKLIYSKNINHDLGSPILEFPVSNFPSGMYIYQVKGKSIRQSGKFMVDHSK